MSVHRPPRHRSAAPRACWSFAGRCDARPLRTNTCPPEPICDPRRSDGIRLKPPASFHITSTLVPFSKPFSPTPTRNQKSP
jgi:hypothetical protein